MPSDKTPESNFPDELRKEIDELSNTDAGRGLEARTINESMTEEEKEFSATVSLIEADAEIALDARTFAQVAFEKKLSEVKTEADLKEIKYETILMAGRNALLIILPLLASSVVGFEASKELPEVEAVLATGALTLISLFSIRVGATGLKDELGRLDQLKNFKESKEGTV